MAAASAGPAYTGILAVLAVSRQRSVFWLPPPIMYSSLIGRPVTSSSSVIVLAYSYAKLCRTPRTISAGASGTFCPVSRQKALIRSGILSSIRPGLRKLG